jgi:hypothetical protein
VQIEGAWFQDRLALSYGRLQGHLSLERCRFEQGIELRAQTIEGWLSLYKTFLGKPADPAKLADDLASLDLTMAKIGGTLNLSSSTIKGQLKSAGLEVHRDLQMEGTQKQPASFAEVDLSSAYIEGDLVLVGATVTASLDLTQAKIGGALNLSSSTIKGQLKSAGLEVHRDLQMGGTQKRPASFAEVDLTRAHIEGSLSLLGATVTGRLKMISLQVGEDLLMRVADDDQPSRFEKDVDLSYAEISGALTLSGASFAVGENTDTEASARATFDMSAAKINGELRLDGVEWAENAWLILRNAHASALHEDGRWPKRVELHGFTYDRIGGVGETDSGDSDRELFHDRKAFCKRYIKDWLVHDPTYTPQPYEQLADVLRKGGEPERAADVLYASREQARHKAAGKRFSLFGLPPMRVPTLRYIGMTLLKWTIGYGLGSRYFYCLIWIVLFIIIGAIVVHEGGNNMIWRGSIEWGDCVVYSIVKLLPFANLDEFKWIALSSLAKWYFYFHQLVGYVFAGFLAGGLAGLTQKS